MIIEIEIGNHIHEISFPFVTVLRCEVEFGPKPNRKSGL